MKKDNQNYKIKKVADLIRFIRNSTDCDSGSRKIITPNYSLLLGAGASVSSGIRSGSDLIKLWKQEVYNADDEKGEISIDGYFKSGNAPRWYDESMAYSCLFENRYDLQRQRRIFVEKEVAGKTPSIGYAYLVKLIESGYFNTVFTTNFDDLLNEAFYRFSKQRPIVCAHDSSISGITVTSSRPKIIKLHGDYLFDNIKATQRETESLETNMKMKFQEFAKDFGLIVIGYSGNDRSIMDILLDLVRGENHFKNGIYWCVRGEIKEEYFSSELKRLLEKERVFLVQIDGFDELFSELNFFLNDGCLPVDDSFLTFRHQKQIIEDLTAKVDLKSRCSYLLRDCDDLKTRLEDSISSEIYKALRTRKSMFKESKDQLSAERKNPYPDMTSEQLNEIEDLAQEAYVKVKKESVLKKLKDKRIFNLVDSRFKLELLEWEADLSENMNDEEILRYFNELIRLNPDNKRYYLIAANRSVGFLQKKQFFTRGLSEFPNDIQIINNYVKFLLNYCEEYPDLSKCEEYLNIIDENINRSLELYKQISNKAYYYKYRWINLKYGNDTAVLKTKEASLCEDVIALSNHHPNTIKILRLTKHNDFSEDKIKKAIEFYKSADIPELVEGLYIELIKHYSQQGNFEAILKVMQEFEETFIGSDNYKYEKVEIYKSYEYFEDALDLLDTLPKNTRSIKERMAILGMMKKDVSDIFENYPDKAEIEELYLSVNNKHGELIEFYKNKLGKDGYLKKDNIILYAYSLLKEGGYEDVVKFLKPYYEKPNITDGTIKVNYLFALLKCGKESKESISKKVKKNIIDKPNINTSDYIQLGASCVIGDKNEIITALTKILKKRPCDKYMVREWPILEPYLTDPRIQKMLTPALKKI